MARISLVPNRQEEIRSAWNNVRPYLCPFSPSETVDVVLYHINRRSRVDDDYLKAIQNLPGHDVLTDLLSFERQKVSHAFVHRGGYELRNLDLASLIFHFTTLANGPRRLSFHTQLACLELRERLCEVNPNNIDKVRRDVKRWIDKVRIAEAYIVRHPGHPFEEKMALRRLGKLLRAYDGVVCNPALEAQLMMDRADVLSYKEDKIRALVTAIWLIAGLALGNIAVGLVAVGLKGLVNHAIDYAPKVSMYVGLSGST